MYYLYKNIKINNKITVSLCISDRDFSVLSSGHCIINSNDSLKHRLNNK